MRHGHGLYAVLDLGQEFAKVIIHSDESDSCILGDLSFPQTQKQ